MKLISSLLRAPVELVAGIALVGLGAVVQAQSTSGDQANTLLLVSGGIMVALGGVLLSWIAARAQSEAHAERAVDEAKSEVDAKLDNLSRVLGQAAGQIGQAVDQVENHQVPPATGFALVSQATRMIYGQVNEIAVIRGVSFDSAYLLETAAKLDDLARQLSAPGAGESPALADVREQLAAFRRDLSATGSGVRSYEAETVACPYCDSPNRVQLGSLPGDTAAATCFKCEERFNAHRGSSGNAFARQRGASNGPAGVPPTHTWRFACPDCGRSIPIADDGKQRRMVCPSCFMVADVDPSAKEVTKLGQARQMKMTEFGKSGSRPVVQCPDCGQRKNALLSCSAGYFAFCSKDLVALIVETAAFESLLDDGVRPMEVMTTPSSAQPQ